MPFMFLFIFSDKSGDYTWHNEKSSVIHSNVFD